MADGGNKVGEVYVEIKATGGDSIAKEVQRGQAQAAAVAPNGFTQLPAWAGSAGASSTMTMGGGGATAVREVTASVKEQADVVAKAADTTNKFTEAKKSLRQEMVSLRQNIMGTVAIIGSFATAIGAGIQGLIGFKNAARDVSDGLRDINEGLSIVTTAGQSDFDTLTKSANKYHATVQRGIDLERESATELLNALLSNSKIKADISADGLKIQIADSDALALREAQNNASLKEDLEDIATLEKNRADHAKEALSYKNATSQLSNFNKEADATIAAQRRAEMAELEGAERIRKQAEFDIEDLQKKKIAATEDDVKALIDMQIAARNRQEKAELASFQKTQDEKEKIQRESEKRDSERMILAARQSADAIASAYASANERIMSNFGSQLSQSVDEMGQYVKLIAEGVGRN